MRASRQVTTTAAVALLAATLSAAPAAADPAPADQATARGPHGGAEVDLDVLFVGAHPDDEAGSLSALGQWNEFHDLTAGVITVTRGEGGGNAVGLEEGPELGLLREAEERRAVAHAGIENVYNLDKIDFYYTASAPLSDQAWDGEDSLERVVRVIRETRPEVIVTMNPSPTGGNHGNHQQAARLAVEGYFAAADPAAFPDQLDGEGLATWRAGRILQSGGSGTGATGSACESTAYQPTDATDRVFGVWQGRTSEETGETWALRERKAQWEYVSQGWAGFPAPPDDPEQIGCDWYTLIDSRTPHADPAAPEAGGTAALEGAALPVDGGLPLGTELSITPERFRVLPGETFGATVTVLAPSTPLVHPELAITAPEGWSVEQAGTLPRVLKPGGSATVDVVVIPPADATLDERATLAATLTARGGAGTNTAAVETVPAVQGRLAQRPEAKVFAEWTAEQNLPKLESLIPAIASVGVGRTQPVTVDVVNDGETAASGEVSLTLSEGFTAQPATQPFDALAPGETASVTFDVTNTDTSLPTSNQAAEGGYPFEIVTTVDGGGDTSAAVLELVPTTEILSVDAPVVDGVADAAEYPGEEIDVSTRWEGEEATAEDASGSARFSVTDDALYVLVDVTDDTLGTVLTPEDCKRHWRTDAVEITVDPRGTSSNSSTTFKTGIFPVTDDPDAGNPPCFQRDADNNQGPGEETAPGMEVASVVNEPYDGYTIEAKIPFDVLPDTIDPARLGLNVLVYDSDTQDKTGQTRIGWSTFGGVQADPFRWALATAPGLPVSEPAPVEPTLPDTAAQSSGSPQSIAQSAADGVPLGGGPGLPAATARITSAELDGSDVVVDVMARAAGQARVFVRSGDDVVGTVEADVAKGRSSVTVPVTGGADDLEVLVAYSVADASLALARDVG